MQQRYDSNIIIVCSLQRGDAISPRRRVPAIPSLHVWT